MLDQIPSSDQSQGKGNNDQGNQISCAPNTSQIDVNTLYFPQEGL